jgi:MbtH protein
MFDDEDRIFVVVMNAEEQYSIWPIGIDVPKGWSVLEVQGNKQHCLEYIENNWPDIRPLSIRNVI